MLLSRFWYLSLAVSAVMGLSSALLATGIINRQRIAAGDEGLRRDRFELESLLRLDARARLDALAPIAADATVREAVRTRGEGRIDGQDSGKALQGRLRTLNQQLEELRADLLIAVDASGVIIAQEGRKPPRAGAGLGRVPLVERALSGYIADDVWVYDGAVYRMAARPIVDRGQYAGALIHAQRLDGTLAQRLSERLGGASIAFFFRDRVVAGYTPTDVPFAPTQAEIGGALTQVLADARLQKGERTSAIDLGSHRRAVYSLVAGSASAMQVGYGVARSVRVLASPWAMFDETTKEDVQGLPIALLLGALVALFGLAMLTLYWELDRPLKALRNGVEKLAEGKGERLDVATLSGPFRKLGDLIDRAIHTAAEHSDQSKRRTQKANLDEILGPAPESLASSAFSFGGGEPLMGAGPKPTSLPAPAARPSTPSASRPEATPTPLVPGPMDKPSISTQPTRPASIAVPRPPPPRVPSLKVPPPPQGLEDKSVMLRLDGSSDGDPTVVTEIPDQLRNASRDDEQHFQDVFEKYLALRKECGESVSELTYDKFAATLRKNRDQIMGTRPDTRDVRFTVYVKAGKASLKASPVKA